MNDDGARLAGAWLLPDEYFQDFQREFWTDNAGTSWKFERRQEFVEPGDDSWEASRAGDWSESLRILEARRESIADYERKLARNGLEVRRVRVVGKPISTYLIWELSSLNIRNQSGGKIRVVGETQIQRFEPDHALPELFLVGSKVAYQVVYDDDGALNGAVKSTDPDVIRHWVGFVADRYAQGEELVDYFQREVAGLVPNVS